MEARTVRDRNVQLETETSVKERTINDLKKTIADLGNIVLQFQELVAEKKLTLPRSLLNRIQQYSLDLPDSNLCSISGPMIPSPDSYTTIQSSMADSDLVTTWQRGDTAGELIDIESMLSLPLDSAWQPTQNAMGNVTNESIFTAYEVEEFISDRAAQNLDSKVS